MVNPAGQPDQRGAQRYSLMLRAAKVMTPEGEWVCNVREVSATGLRLRFFHDLPEDRYLLIELANGDRYPIEVVWREDDMLGGRFGEAIDVSQFMAEPSPFPRRQLRVNLRCGALITAAGRDFRAQLLDISQQGARVDIGSQLDQLQTVRMEVPGLPLRFGQVRWRDGFSHGLFFDQPMRLDEFARHVHALQGHGAPIATDAPLPPLGLPGRKGASQHGALY